MSEESAKILATALESVLVTQKGHFISRNDPPNNVADAILEVARAITRLAVAVETMAARDD